MLNAQPGYPCLLTYLVSPLPHPPTHPQHACMCTHLHARMCMRTQTHTDTQLNTNEAYSIVMDLVVSLFVLN